MKRPEGRPEWMIRFGSWLLRPFGVSPDYAKRTPWESVRRHLDEVLYQEFTISMDGRGRFLDNIFVERLWRTVKYEEVYLKDYLSVPEAISNLNLYFRFYNQERGHQALDYLGAIYLCVGQRRL